MVGTTTLKPSVVLIPSEKFSSFMRISHSQSIRIATDHAEYQQDYVLYVQGELVQKTNIFLNIKIFQIFFFFLKSNIDYEFIADWFRYTELEISGFIGRCKGSPNHKKKWTSFKIVAYNVTTSVLLSLKILGRSFFLLTYTHPSQKWQNVKRHDRPI